jgi:hypothetical protein
MASWDAGEAGITTTHKLYTRGIGTAKAVTNLLELTNSYNAADMVGTGTGLLFRQWYYDAVTPAVADAGQIVSVIKDNWTSGVGESYLSFSPSVNQVLTERVRLDQYRIGFYGSKTWDASEVTAISAVTSGYMDGLVSTVSLRSPTTGGLWLEGFRDSGTNPSIDITAWEARATLAPAIRIRTFLHDGAGANTIIADDRKLIGLLNNDLDRLYVYGNASFEQHYDTISHGMTDYLPTTAYSRFSPIDASHPEYGGLQIIGANDLSSQPALQLYGIKSGSCSSSHYIKLVAGFKSGTGITAIGSDEYAFSVYNDTTQIVGVYGDGSLKLASIPHETTDVDAFLVSNAGLVKYRTGTELLSDIGAAPASHALDSATHTIGSLGNLQLLYGSTSGAVVQSNAAFTVNPTTNQIALTGTASSLTKMPIMNFMFAGDADAVISYLNYSHDNCCLAFDAWFNGATWISSHAGANFAIYKNSSILTIGYKTGIAKGSAFAGGFDLTNGVHFYSTGELVVGSGGTTDPITLNDKFRVADGPMVLGFRDNDTGQGYLVIYSSQNSICGFIGHTNTTDGFVTGTYSNHALTLRTNNANRMIISTAGAVTISALSTAGILHNSAAGLISTSLVVAADIGAVVNTSVIPKGGAANASLVASSITDDGTTVKTTKALGVGTSSTPTTAGVIRCDTGLGVGVDPTSTVIGNLLKDQNAATVLAITNVNNHASAYSEIVAASDAAGANYLALVSAPALGTPLGTAGLSGIACVNTAGCQLNNVSNTAMTFKTNNTVRLTIPAAGGLTIAAGGVLSVGTSQVVGARVIDARCDDTINSGDATTDGVIDSLRDAMIAHGLIAAA